MERSDLRPPTEPRRTPRRLSPGALAPVGLYLRVAGTFGLTAAQAGPNLTVDNVTEAIDLTADWTIANNALDLFVVRAMTDASATRATTPTTTCPDRSLRSVERPPRARVVFTHEMGHYLGLDHFAEAGNVMYPGAWPSNTGIHQSQGDVMKRHFTGCEQAEMINHLDQPQRGGCGPSDRCRQRRTRL